MNTRAAVAITLLGFVVATVVALGGAGASSELSVDDDVDVPEQTVTVEGETYNISSIGKVDSSSTFEVYASAVNDDGYDIYLYEDEDGSKRIVDTASSSPATFDAEQLELDPGTYLLTVNDPDGKTRDIMPVVVEGYDVAASFSDTVTEGDEVTVTVSVTEVDDATEPKSDVEVIVVEDGEPTELSATRVADGEYEVTYAFDEPGEYGIYANVRGQEEVDGEKQLVGLSDRRTITVEAESTPTDTSDDSGDDSSGGSSTDSTPTETPTDTPTDTPTEDTQTEDTPTDTPTEETSTDEPTDSPGTESSPSTPTETDDVITPGGDETESADDSSDEVPLNGPQLLVVLLLLVAAGSRVRS